MSFAKCERGWHRLSQTELNTSRKSDLKILTKILMTCAKKRNGLPLCDPEQNLLTLKYTTHKLYGDTEGKMVCSLTAKLLVLHSYYSACSEEIQLIYK